MMNVTLSLAVNTNVFTDNRQEKDLLPSFWLEESRHSLVKILGHEKDFVSI
jgi:hypothetical protein